MKALFTKLKWQQHNLAYALLTTDQQLEHFTQEIHAAMEKITKTSTLPTFITPEINMAHMHFITQQQQKQDELTIRKTALLSEQVRLNIKLNRLEKHQDINLKIKHRQTLLTQQKTLDEWVLQRWGIK